MWCHAVKMYASLFNCTASCYDSDQVHAQVATPSLAIYHSNPAECSCDYVLHVHRSVPIGVCFRFFESKTDIHLILHEHILYKRQDCWVVNAADALTFANIVLLAHKSQWMIMACSWHAHGTHEFRHSCAHPGFSKLQIPFCPYLHPHAHSRIILYAQASGASRTSSDKVS